MKHGLNYIKLSKPDSEESYDVDEVSMNIDKVWRKLKDDYEEKIHVEQKEEFKYLFKASQASRLSSQHF